MLFVEPEATKSYKTFAHEHNAGNLSAGDSGRKTVFIGFF
jgi:hypothetical protein